MNIREASFFIKVGVYCWYWQSKFFIILVNLDLTIRMTYTVVYSLK